MNSIVITPPGKFNLPRWRELWEARDVLYQFGYRDILLRYRQTAVGVVWVLLQPLASAGIFSIIFGNIAQLPSDGVPYFLFTYVSMLAWTLFSGVVGRASGSLVSNQALVAKVFFPRMLVPLWMLLILLLGLGIGMAASAIMVQYRDVAYVLPWLLQVGLYATPVAYALSAVPSHLQWLFLANPMSWLLEAFRFSLVGTAPPPGWQIASAVLISLGVFVGGALVFQSRERAFADLI